MYSSNRVKKKVEMPVNKIIRVIVKYDIPKLKLSELIFEIE